MTFRPALVALPPTLKEQLDANPGNSPRVIERRAVITGGSPSSFSPSPAGTDRRGRPRLQSARLTCNAAVKDGSTLSPICSQDNRLDEASIFASEHRDMIEQAFFDKKTKQQVVEMLSAEFQHRTAAE